MAKHVMLAWGFFLLFVIGSPRTGEAQIRVSAGTTSATVGGDDARMPFGEDRGEAVELGTETGFFAGASLRVPLSGIVSLNPGLYFVQKGTTFDRDQGFKTGSVELSYVEVPVKVGVAVTGADRPLGVSLFAGPEISFEVNCTLQTDPGFDILLPYGQFDDCFRPTGVEESDRKSTLFGLVFGADVTYGDFLVEGGLDVGLTSLDDSDANQDFKNLAWFLGGGILIGL